jgi:hypothetical protein
MHTTAGWLLMYPPGARGGGAAGGGAAAAAASAAAAAAPAAGGCKRPPGGVRGRRERASSRGWQAAIRMRRAHRPLLWSPSAASRTQRRGWRQTSRLLHGRRRRRRRRRRKRRRRRGRGAERCGRRQRRAAFQGGAGGGCGRRGRRKGRGQALMHAVARVVLDCEGARRGDARRGDDRERRARRAAHKGRALLRGAQ